MKNPVGVRCYGCVVLVVVVVVEVDVLGAVLVFVEVDGAMDVSVLGADIDVSEVVVSVVDEELPPHAARPNRLAARAAAITDFNMRFS